METTSLCCRVVWKAHRRIHSLLFDPLRLQPRSRIRDCGSEPLWREDDVRKERRAAAARGGKLAVELPRPEMLEPLDYCALYCRSPNRLRLVNAHPEVVTAVEAALTRHLLDFRLYWSSRATCAFKLHGEPFQHLGSSEEKTIRVKRAIAAAIVLLQASSWEVVVSTDIGKVGTNSCLFFRKVVILDQHKKAMFERDGDIFIFSPSGQHSLLLIDVPVNIETELVENIREIVSVEDYSLLDTASNLLLTSKMKLAGCSWTSTGEQAVAVRKMVLAVIRVARGHKYELVTNLNTKGTTDSLLFQHKSSLLNTPEDMFIMSLNRNDRLRIIGAPNYIEIEAEEVVGEHWGVQGVAPYAGSYELKLYGTPWWADGEDTVKARHVVGHLIARFKSLGWEVAATVDVSRKLQDKTVFIFRQCPPEQQDFCVLSFHGSDKIRFLSNFPDTFSITDGIDRILDAANLTQNISFYWKAKQWQIKGVPFSGNMNHGVEQRMMVHLLTKVLRVFHLLGWRLVASADISAKYHKSNNQEFALDTHSWFFLHDPASVLLSEVDTDTEAVDLSQLPLDQFALDEIKSERSKCRVFLRVQLPFLIILLFISWYVLSIIGVF